MQHVVSLFWKFDLISIIAGSSPVSCSNCSGIIHPGLHPGPWWAITVHDAVL